ncbi:Protein tpx2 [Borealophlyctis nickersoniae]|nr:Protein tpx2 [Borealophlyctis nickersoniae]
MTARNSSRDSRESTTPRPKRILMTSNPDNSSIAAAAIGKSAPDAVHKLFAPAADGGKAKSQEALRAATQSYKETAAVKENDRDPNYEFNAPQYHDFTGIDGDSDADKWFDIKNMSPEPDDSDDEYNESMDEPYVFQLTDNLKADDFKVNTTPKTTRFASTPHPHETMNADEDDGEDHEFTVNEAPKATKYAKTPRPRFTPNEPQSDDEDDEDEEYTVHEAPATSKYAKTPRPESKDIPDDDDDTTVEDDIFPVMTPKSVKKAKTPLPISSVKATPGYDDEIDACDWDVHSPLERKKAIAAFTFKLPDKKAVPPSFPPEPKSGAAESSAIAENESNNEKNVTIPAVKDDSKKSGTIKPTKTKTAAKRPPARTVKPLTIPMEFSFSSRLGKKSQGGVQKKKPAPKKKSGITVPKPFNLSTSLRNHRPFNFDEKLSAKSPFVPLAVKVKQFENTVPDRFRPVPARSKMSAARHSYEPRRTYPKSPYLLTKLRKKIITVPSTQEMEEAEMQKTQPFRAQPLHRKILQRAVGIPERAIAELTVPQSPAITKPRPLPARTPSPPKLVKANPIRHYPVFQPKLEHRATFPADYALPGEEISQRKRREFEEAMKQKQEEEENARRFKAQPLPEDDVFIPHGPERPVTSPHPFHLETDIRGALHRMTLEEKRAKELEEAAAAKRFVAKPIPALEPFIPKKSDRPVTEPDDVVLHSDVRAEERRAFEEQQREKERADEERKERHKREQEEREKEEIRRLRQQQVHHAQPIKQYAPVMVAPSNRKLTEPESPMIGEKRKKAMMARGQTAGGMVGSRLKEEFEIARK